MHRKELSQEEVKLNFFYQAACRSVIAAFNLARIYTKERIIFLRLTCKSLGYGIELD